MFWLTVSLFFELFLIHHLLLKCIINITNLEVKNMKYFKSDDNKSEDKKKNSIYKSSMSSFFSAVSGSGKGKH